MAFGFPALLRKSLLLAVLLDGDGKTLWPQDATPYCPQ
jgi:hypothetical protein